MTDHSYLYNTAFIDQLYETYLLNPTQLSEEWRDYFVQLQQEMPSIQPEIPHTPIRERFAFARSPVKSNGADLHSITLFADKQVKVLQLINAYRFRGHQKAHLDPLELYPRPEVPELHPEFYGLTQADMRTVFNTGSLYGVESLSLADILKRLEKIYCGTIGAEYMHITETKQKRWIQQRLEGTLSAPNFLISTKLNILERLTAAQGIEELLHSQYVGQKRFSLEGAESLIPLLDELVRHSGGQGIQEIVLGMAHRGRLNVLINILGKRPKDLFSEFEGTHQYQGSGDVKYHQGFSCDVISKKGPMHLALAFNPSHLEIICPVVEGAVRARQERIGDKQQEQVLPVLIHGDAAFAGQGVVMETFNFSQTRGYTTGGTLHIVINNQIGFTTSDPLDSRSALYCTDVAKMVQAPIFHVNGDDPEAVLYVAKLALKFRMEFHKDVVIDMVCYRRHGHNESDDPVPTQPLMYRKIAQHPKVQTIYSQRLVEEEVIEPEESELLLQQYKAALKTKDRVAPYASKEGLFKHGINWKPYIGTHWTVATDTQIESGTLHRLMQKLVTFPPDFTLARSVEKVIESRQKMITGELPFDWGGAEILAYASLLEEGYPVRLSGQDSGRGTFAHRHAILHDQSTGKVYLPLQHLSDKQAPFLVINSTLSEEAVLAFEYGYSASDPDTLVLWEAQFGDFANGAQVVIDQFISSSEAKWQRYCGLVMLLPHGYDGQGPEHSSARLERYLQLCAEDNIQVCVPSTPAQFFHLLRRQMRRPYRKPLIVMTPKSLLRHKRAVSEIREFTQSGFQTVIDEVADIPRERVKRLLFCSGKVYFDLVEAREKQGREDVAIIRLEQLYPYPKVKVAEILESYPHVQQRLWVQEEPRNQGAWWYMRAHMDINLSHQEGGRLEYAGRPSSASPAAGSYSLHRQQLETFLAEALGNLVT